MRRESLVLINKFVGILARVVYCFNIVGKLTRAKLISGVGAIVGVCIVICIIRAILIVIISIKVVAR